MENMNWYILNDYQIDKKEVGADQYEYITQFTTNQKVTYNDGSKDTQQKFRIHARVNAEFRIVNSICQNSWSKRSASHVQVISV